MARKYREPRIYSNIYSILQPIKVMHASSFFPVFRLKAGLFIRNILQ